MNMGMITDIMGIMQRGYGNVTATPIDRVVASQVINYFYEKGWMNSEEIAFLVEAAGGEIRVSEELLLGDRPLLYRQQDPITHEIVFRTRKKEDVVKEAKVNPDAEVRVVDSGPIDLKPVEHRDGNSGTS